MLAKVRALLRVTIKRIGRIADQAVDLAGLQSREAVSSQMGLKSTLGLHPPKIAAENPRQIGIKPLIVFLGCVYTIQSLERIIDATYELPTCFYFGE